MARDTIAYKACVLNFLPSQQEVERKVFLRLERRVGA
jgi:hypothetical protein